MPEGDLIGLLLSASLGALIGLERQWDDQQDGKKDGKGEQRNLGLRTFVLWALLGCVAAILDRDRAPGFFAIAYMVFAILILTQGLIKNPGYIPPGLTTRSAALMTFLIGAMAIWENRREASILGITTLLLLAYKRSIHGLSRKFTEQDVRSALTFLAITGVVLPVAPNQDYGPYGAFNPFQIWLMVVLVAGLGFFGYVAIRLLGARAGIGAMGLLGGLASSTATTLTFSKQSRERPELSASFAMGIILACTIMLGRVAILVFVTDRDLLPKLLPWLVGMCIPGALYTAWHLFSSRSAKGKRENESPNVSNPLSLMTGIKFAALYVVIIFMARAMSDLYGSAGVNVISLLSGLTDMDAIALSLARSAASDSIEAGLATGGILLGAVSNTILKGLFAISTGAKELRTPIIAVFIPTLLIGLAGWWFVR